jgi:alpha-methylacyl-CoA racemase
MVDGSAYLATSSRLGTKTYLFDRARGESLLDGGCPWYDTYDTYETKDGKFVAVGCLEPQFFALMLKGLGLEGRGFEKTRYDRKTWPELRRLFKRALRGKLRYEWEQIFDGTDACVTPVLDMTELENASEREGDQRPAVTLGGTPSLAIKTGRLFREASEGQGEGVLGDGWTGIPLKPSDGGEQVLDQWLGWKKGTDFEVENGGLITRQMLKL